MLYPRQGHACILRQRQHSLFDYIFEQHAGKNLRPFEHLIRQMPILVRLWQSGFSLELVVVLMKQILGYFYFFLPVFGSNPLFLAMSSNLC